MLTKINYRFSSYFLEPEVNKIIDYVWDYEKVQHILDNHWAGTYTPVKIYLEHIVLFNQQPVHAGSYGGDTYEQLMVLMTITQGLPLPLIVYDVRSLWCYTCSWSRYVLVSVSGVTPMAG